MINWKQLGDDVYIPAPSGGVLSGQFVVIGSMFGIAAYDAAAGAVAVIRTHGIVSIPKESAEVWTVGLPIYWNATDLKATSTVGSNLKIGVATAAPPYTAAAGSGAAFGDVRLNSAF